MKYMSHKNMLINILTTTNLKQNNKNADSEIC
jgi:hypothetical protein